MRQHYERQLVRLHLAGKSGRDGYVYTISTSKYVQMDNLRRLREYPLEYVKLCTPTYFAASQHVSHSNRLYLEVDIVY